MSVYLSSVIYALKYSFVVVNTTVNLSQQFSVVASESNLMPQYFGSFSFVSHRLIKRVDFWNDVRSKGMNWSSHHDICWYTSVHTFLKVGKFLNKYLSRNLIHSNWFCDRRTHFDLCKAGDSWIHWRFDEGGNWNFELFKMT